MIVVVIYELAKVREIIETDELEILSGNGVVDCCVFCRRRPQIRCGWDRARTRRT